jgi:presqualene diphosphate synthase
VFGMGEPPGRDLAHHLGRALQITNILRDLDEDAAIGRLYLPAEALAEAGIESREPAEVLAHGGIDRACRQVAAAARDHYRRADAILAARPAGRLAAPRLMSAVYGEILSLMEAAGWSAPRARVKVGKGRLAWLALRRGLLA